MRFVPKYDSKKGEYVGVRPISNLHSMYELRFGYSRSEQSRSIRAAYQVVKTLWNAEKSEVFQNISFYSTENTSEGFQLVNQSWDKPYLQAMDVYKCFDSIQVVSIPLSSSS